MIVAVSRNLSVFSICLGSLMETLAAKRRKMHNPKGGLIPLRFMRFFVALMLSLGRSSDGTHPTP